MRWQPAHEAHAIERVNLTFQLADAIPPKPWQAILSAISAEMPKEGFTNTFDEHEPNLNVVPVAGQQPHVVPGGLGPLIQFGMGGPVPPFQFVVSGRTFQSLNGGELREEVQVQRRRLAYSATIYNGWEAHRGRALTLLGPYLDRVLPMVNVETVKLEYWDRFVFDGPGPEAAFGELLHADSRYLPGFAFTTDQLWHSHVGHFMPAADGVRRLINVNVDVIDLLDPVVSGQLPGAPAPRRSVGVYTMAQDSLGEGLSPNASAGTVSMLDELHTILKAVFGDVITAEAADRIALNAQALT